MVRWLTMNKFLYDSVENALVTLNSISNSLAVIATTLHDDIQQKVSMVVHELPPDCMDFDEWASLLSSDNRQRLMWFLWHHKFWHHTCVRKEADNG
jgi:hypothetical protein